MKRIKMLAGLALATGAVLLALAVAPVASQAATVELRETMLGPIIVNEAGFTLYNFTADKKHQDHCVNIEEVGYIGAPTKCTTVWPPLLVGEGETPTVGPGLKSKLLGTTTLPSGAKQVTYKKHPLYTYSKDAGPGETGYVGFAAFGGKWYAQNAKGKVIK